MYDLTVVKDIHTGQDHITWYIEGGAWLWHV